MRRLLLAAATVGALAFLAWNVGRHWFLCDDAFISFRYVRNLVDGHGLVFNRGERVEGYTNFLWVLELAAGWAWFDLRPERLAPWLSVACTAACVPLVLLLGRGERGRPHGWTVGVLALVLWCTNRSVAVWATSGLETRQFTLAVLLGWWAASRARHGLGWLGFASLAFGVAELTRPEALLIGPAVLGATLLLGWRDGDRRVVPWLVAAAPFAVLVGAHEVFRLAYYGELLPNTYYAKAVRPWWDMGGLFLGQVALEHALYLILPLGVVGTLVRTRSGDRTLLLGWAFAVPMLLHLARLGGDHFEHRVLDELWPVFHVAAAEGIVALALRAGREIRPVLAPVVGVTASAVVLAYALAIPLAHDHHTLGMRRSEAKALHLELSERHTPFLGALPGMDWIVWLNDRASGVLIRHWVGNRHISHDTFCRDQLRRYAAYERVAGTGFLPPDAVTSRHAVGVHPFVLPDLTVIDENGLTDHTVARNPVRYANRNRRMAHEREPPPGYLASRGVNLWVQDARRTQEDALRAGVYALQLADDLWMAFDSHDPDWVERAFGGRAVAREGDPFRRAMAARVVPPAVSVEGPDTWLGVPVVRWLGRFEDGTDGWHLAGAAFLGGEAEAGGEDGTDDGDDASLAAPTGGEGAGLLDSRILAHGKEAVGVAVSPAFVPREGDVLVALVGGGDEPGTGLFLVDEERNVLASWTGLRDPVLRPVALPLAPWVGRTLHLEARDPRGRQSVYVLVDGVALVSAVPSTVATR